MKHNCGMIFLFLTLIGCQDNVPIPKKRSYFRIDLPEKRYKAIDFSCPFMFDVSEHAAVERIATKKEKSDCWFNITYKDLNAKIHLSYKPILTDSSYEKYTEDAHNFVYKHTVKASGIEQQEFIDQEQSKNSVLYFLKGNTASPVQFYVSDSLTHFLRGALYFDHVPNADSLEPVIEYLSKDIRHLIESLQWKK